MNKITRLVIWICSKFNKAWAMPGPMRAVSEEANMVHVLKLHELRRPSSAGGAEYLESDGNEYKGSRPLCQARPGAKKSATG